MEGKPNVPITSYISLFLILKLYLAYLGKLTLRITITLRLDYISLSLILSLLSFSTPYSSHGVIQITPCLSQGCLSFGNRLENTFFFFHLLFLFILSYFRGISCRLSFHSTNYTDAQKLIRNFSKQLLMSFTLRHIK